MRIFRFLFTVMPSSRHVRKLQYLHWKGIDSYVKTDLWQTFIAIFLIMSLSACEAEVDVQTSPTPSTNAIQMDLDLL